MLSFMCCQLSVYLILHDITAHDEISQAFTSIFAHWKQTNTGGGEDLGTSYCCYSSLFSVVIFQATYSSDLPCETISKINLVDLAGR